MLRGGNFTSQVFDFFAGLGFAARARDLRYVWKSHMLFWCIAGFVAGACIGANAFENTLQANCIAVPVAMLGALWLYGAALLALRRLRGRGSGGSRDLKQQLMKETGDADEYMEESAEADSNRSFPGEYEVFDTRQFLWIVYVCFVAG